MTFQQKYPLLATWVECEGRIEIGSDDYSYSLLRIINGGGMVWEDDNSNTIDKALEKGEAYLKNDFEKDFGYKVGA